jgi:cytochrome c peroxidase
MDRSVLERLGAALVVTCAIFAGPAWADDAGLAGRAKAAFGVLPEVAANPANPVTDAKVALGRQLYFDPRLSVNQDISCNSCHRLDGFGVDGEATSPGHKGQRGDRNSPTVYNAALHFTQFWDGRAADVEEQALGPVTNPIEMAMPDAAAVDAMLRSIPGYRDSFAAAFAGEEEPVSFANAALAIAVFERTLLTPAPLDAFIAGDADALDAAQQRGLELFLSVGCTTCHMGAPVGGTMFQKLGLVHPYETADPGRFKVTGNESDRGFFKVPGLRNVAKTGPWFHDGSIATLGDAVRKMAWHQLGRELTDAEVGDLVAFLGALTGAPSAELMAAPQLPPSGPGTPPPDPS